MSRITKTLIDAELIKRTRALNFGEFSNDAQYLEIHYIDDMLDALGCPEDDYKNYFTARMLLMLESYPLYNTDLYFEILKKIVSAYFRDYHDHDKDFRPMFLVNDILRFWKTLCLNYEHKRNRPTNDRYRKNSTHLKNLKLKFSRMITCFATIIILINKKQEITQSELIKILHLPPFERMKLACVTNSKYEEFYNEILKEYVWFLEMTGRSQQEVIKWIGTRRNRDRAFERGRKFGSKVYSLLHEVADPTDLRYLII